MLGTLSAIGGTLITMLVASAGGFIAPELMMFDMKMWLIAANCGLAGALLDSVMGASFQAQYKCKCCHHWTESHSHCEQPAALVRGVKFINNDFVNFTCTIFAAMIAAAVMLFGV